MAAQVTLPDPKSFLQSTTLWLNVIGMLALALADPSIVGLLPDGSTKYVAATLALLNILNRLRPGPVPLTIATPAGAKRKARATRAARSRIEREEAEVAAPEPTAPPVPIATVPLHPNHAGHTGEPHPTPTAPPPPPTR